MFLSVYVKNNVKYRSRFAAGGTFMIKRILCVVAIVLLVLMLGVRLDEWREEGVSLVGEVGK